MENTLQLYYLISISFIVYFILSYVYKILKIQNIERALLTTKGVLLLNIKHLIGILLFGILFYQVTPDYRKLITANDFPGLNILLVLVGLIIISAMVAYHSVNKKKKTTIELSQHSSNQRWIYFSLRIVFLFAYEFFFRGVLLFSLIEINGLITAVIICTSLYVLIHAFDSRAEIIGAIPFGIILCFLSYFTNNIWAAFILHITLSGVYEISMFNHLTRKTYSS